MVDNAFERETPLTGPTPAAEKRWTSLTEIQRRVTGVLVEKAKTTPEQYPLSLNALTNGCNQKSNRNPQMSLDMDDVEGVLDELRELGATVEIQSGGRVAKYKHCLYEWLGVDKAELAVMAELLLRGEQTVGELRGRAGRMEPIADLSALRPIVNSLIEKELVMSLTPEGRGQVVAHALYDEQDLARLKSQYENFEPTRPARSPTPQAASSDPDEFRQLQAEVAELRAELEQLRSQFEQLMN
ncbi:MAG: YceH family protein [Pirellulaceae bacterium]